MELPLFVLSGLAVIIWPNNDNEICAENNEIFAEIMTNIQVEEFQLKVYKNKF